MKKFNYLLATFIVLGINTKIFCQSYHVVMGGLGVYELEVTNHSSCNYEYIGQISIVGNCAGLTSTPDSLLLLHCHSSISGDGLKEIDQTTAFFNNYFDHVWPLNTVITGVVSLGNGIYYALNFSYTTNISALYKIDINSGSVIYIGDLPYTCSSEMTLFNGEIYYPWHTLIPDRILKGIVKVDTLNPEESELIVSISGDLTVRALTASDICNTLLAGTEEGNFIYYINLLDGVITSLCDSPLDPFNITGLVEFEAPDYCPVLLDLDQDNSTDMPEYDYAGEEFNCLSDGVKVTDEDIHVQYDALITEMTVDIVGFIPDAPLEILEMQGSIAEIDVTGDGTSSITFTNTGGAKSTDFKEALKLVRYNNLSLHPAGGMRTINVQFTTEAGSMSNIATAFIQVNELPLVQVDLGADQEICDGETATFDAGNPGATYEWSTGETSQSITVSEEGHYVVTVSDGENCPNQDTAGLIVLPLVHVSLEGDLQICDNQQATLIINTDSPFPLTVEISANPGSPFIFNNVTGTFTFNDLPAEDTQYTITSVSSSEVACFEITDPEHSIDVDLTYIHSVEATICEGDSIWLGYYWENEAGVYENTFETFDGCDSIVTTTLTVSGAINISMAATTCDSTAAGVFIEHLNNPDGCDTVVTTIITLLPGDTTYLISTDCNAADTGVFTLTLSNINGCDSVVISDVNYIATPNTYTDVFTCDSSLLGISQQTFIAQDGCDSVVVTTTHMSPPDTTYLNATSCDSASLGVFEEHFVSQNGCDSIVFTTVEYSENDSTFVQSTTCDPAMAGIIVDHLINRFGCDSIVTSTVALLPSDETFISSATCDKSQAGIFSDTLSNAYGCDSVIITQVYLNPSHEIFQNSTTCISSEAGTFINAYQNQYGCDSTVTLIISLVPADTTSLFFKTCDPAQAGTNIYTHTNQDGCDSIVIERTDLFPLPELSMEVISDFNGYSISCYGETDGSITANVTGVPPFEYLWSTSATDQSLTGLSAGAYAVTITDGNECTATSEVMLFEPPEFSIGFTVTHPDCFDENAGTIVIEHTGGVEPIRYTIDGSNYQSSPVFNDLAGGAYEITAVDANECEVKEILWINVPLLVSVELGDDMQLLPGDTAIILAIVNVPFDSLSSIIWTGLNNPDCPNCLTQPVAPIITTTYSVEVSTQDGCKDEDELALFVEYDIDVYVPNIFSPNGDGVNDIIIINAGNSVEEILEFVVFDRWGNVVHEDDHFNANDPSHAWDGTRKQHALNPGVFAYKMMVQFADGRQDVFYGEVTLIR